MNCSANATYYSANGPSCKHEYVATFIHVHNWVVATVCIQIAALDDGHKAGGVVVVVELQGVIAVDHVAYVPVGVLLGEAADDGVIVSGPEIVSPSLLVIILPGVAEGVGIGGDRALHWGLPGFYFVFW